VEADLGEARPGTELRATFPIRNTGGRPLLIEQLRTSCGLNAYVEPSRALAPGEAASIVVSQTAPVGRGERLQTITVYSNDPRQPSTTLRVRSRLTADIAAEPAELYVGSLRPGQEAPLPVKILPRPGLSVQHVEVEGAEIEAWLESGNGRQHLRARASQHAPAGPFQAMMIAHTATTALRIPVVGIIEESAP
jgi:hypothetical protein